MIVFWFFLLFAWCGDWLDFLAYLARVQQGSIAAFVLAAALAGWVTMRLLQPCVDRADRAPMDRAAWVILVLMGGFFLFKAAVPDTSTDVEYYHLYLQSPGFRDVFGQNFAPAALGSVIYPLADRLFYWFRMLLGYRLGTVLNCLLAMLVFFQVRDLYLSFWRAHWGASVLAGASVLVYQLVMQLGGSYMVDLVALPLLLEMLRCALFAPARQKGDVYYFAFLAAAVLTVKLNNVFYVLPLGLWFLWHSRRLLSFRCLALSLAVLCLPGSLYAIYSFLETGSPLYPFYNAIFQSPYFPVLNVLDSENRWGPVSWAERLCWPWHLALYPGYRLCELVEPLAAAHLGGLLAAVCFLLRGLWSRSWREGHALEWGLGLVFLGSAYCWTFLSGYARYFLFGMILGNIVFVRGLFLLRGCGWRRLTAVLLVPLLLAPVLAFYETGLGHEWSWRERRFHSGYRQELGRFLRDRQLVSAEQAAQVGAFVQLDVHGSAYAHIIRPDVPVLSYWMAQHGGPYGAQVFSERLAGLWADGRRVYDVHVPGERPVQGYIDQLNAAGLRLVRIESAAGNILRSRKPWLCELQPGTERNQLLELSPEGIRIPVKGEGPWRMRFCAGFLADWLPVPAGLRLQAVAVFQNGNYCLMREWPLHGERWMQVDEVVDRAGLDGLQEIRIVCLQADGQGFSPAEDNLLMLLNPTVEAVKQGDF